jgi:GNAT superfamily N-acetyltransferase
MSVRDLVRYPPAGTPAIPEAEGMIVDAAPEAAAGLSGRLSLAGLLVRRAEAGDRSALEAMFQRCTLQTVYRRFHGQVKSFPAGYLAEALAGLPDHFALVACSGDQVVALASCRVADGGDGRAPDGADLGILIEDAWQRRGLGSELLDRLVAHADSLGLSALDAQVLSEQDWLIRLLLRYGECTSAFHCGVREVRLRRDSSGRT